MGIRRGGTLIRGILLCTLTLAGKALPSHARPILNGIATTEFPEVVQVKLVPPTELALLKKGEPFGSAGCSGIQLSDNTVLTASHCVHFPSKDSNRLPPEHSFIVRSDGAWTAARSIFYNTSFEAPSLIPHFIRGYLKNPHDLAVIISDKLLPLPRYPKIGTLAPRPGEPVTFVGYGKGPTPQGQGEIRRKGTNALLKARGGMLFTEGATHRGRKTQETGTDASPAGGDSGGAVYSSRTGELIGVIAWIGHGLRMSRDRIAEKAQTSAAVDLSSESSREFLQEAIRFGAKMEFQK